LDPALAINYTDRHQWETEFSDQSREQLTRFYDTYANSSTQPLTNNENPIVTNIDDVPRVLRHAYGNRIRQNQGHHRRNETEVDRYYRRIVEEEFINRDVLTWWKKNQETFPILSLMARDFLAVPGNYNNKTFCCENSKSDFFLGTSVPVERVFSSAKNTLPVQRNCLRPDTIRACMLEKYRLKQTLVPFNDIEEDA
jgi:hypothetical protein